MAGTSLRDLLPEILSLILEELPDLYSLFSAARSLSRPDVWGDLPRISRQIFRCTCLDAKMDERASLPKVFWGLLSATECRELDGNALRRLFDEGWKVSIGLGLEEALIPIGMVLARRLSSEEAIGFLIGLCVRCAPCGWSIFSKGRRPGRPLGRVPALYPVVKELITLLLQAGRDPWFFQSVI